MAQRAAAAPCPPGAGGGLMVSSKAMAVVRQVYDWVELALWAAFLAFMIYFVVHILPTLPQRARRAESMPALKIRAENRSSSRKLGMKQGTEAHCTSVIHLQQRKQTTH